MGELQNWIKRYIGDSIEERYDEWGQARVIYSSVDR